MTREEVLALAPGRELDALVARKLFGVLNPDSRWRPSEDISAAWEVVEEMGDCLHLRQHGEQGEWEAWFCGYPNSKTHGETAPEAICKASLLVCLEV
jgi:hypothetical protein